MSESENGQQAEAGRPVTRWLDVLLVISACYIFAVVGYKDLLKDLLLMAMNFLVPREKVEAFSHSIKPIGFTIYGLCLLYAANYIVWRFIPTVWVRWLLYVLEAIVLSAIFLAFEFS